MNGLLAVSAYHMASLVEDQETSKRHFKQAENFHNTSIKMLSQSGEPPPAVEQELLNCFLPFARRVALSSQHGQNLVSSAECSLTLPTMVARLQDLIRMRPIRLGDHDGISSTSTNDAFRNAAQLVETDGLDKASEASLQRLHALPSDLADALGRSDDVQEVTAVLRAIALLIHAYATSVESADVLGKFDAMSMWLASLPKFFFLMLSKGSPAALVVLARWTISLLADTEDVGSWFLKGLSRSVLSCITAQLQFESRAVQNLCYRLTL